jgi:lysozyme family protein
MNPFIQALIRPLGGILTPVITALVVWLVAQIAIVDTDLAAKIDTAAVAGWVVAAVLALVNFVTNKQQGEAAAVVQSLVDKAVPQSVKIDGVIGENTISAVRQVVSTALNVKGK